MKRETNKKMGAPIKHTDASRPKPRTIRLSDNDMDMIKSKYNSLADFICESQLLLIYGGDDSENDK